MFRIKLLPFLLCIFFVLVALVFNAKAQETVINKYDISDSWRVFNKETRSVDKPGARRKTRQIRWSLNLNNESNGWLVIKAPEGTSLLINSQYYGHISDSLTIDLDSLYDEGHGHLFDFTLYRFSGLSSSNLSSIIYKESYTPREGIPEDRNMDLFFMNFFVSGALFILLFIGVLSNRFPRDTLDYFSFFRSLSFKNREETLISSRPFNRTNVLFIILDSVLIGFLIISMVKLTAGYVYFPFVHNNVGLQELLISWLVASSILFVYLISKYFLISIFNGLYRLGEFRYIQHFNSIRFSLGSFLILFILLTITFLSFRSPELQAYIIYIRILVFLLIIRIVVLFFKLRDFSTYRNFHLFSYLCGTEIIPFIVLYKLVLG